MSLRLDKTATINFGNYGGLTGATQASFSVWIHRVADSTSVQRLFGGDFGDKMEFLHNADGRFQFEFKSDDNIRFFETLTSGQDYHIALTFDNGVHRIYRNGVQVDTDTGADTTVNAGSGKVTFKGIDGLNVLLDDVAIWNDHVLTNAQVRNLRDRISTPDQIGANGPSLYWTLEGTDGADVAVDDPGIVDQGNTSLSTASVTDPAPVWSSQALTYTAPAQVKSAQVMPSGKMIYLEVEKTSDSSETNITTVAHMRNPHLAATVNVTGGGATGGSLPAGDYYLQFTYTNAYGETTIGSSQVGPFTVAAGNIPRVTIPFAPAGGTTNLYLSDTDGAAGTASLYKSEVSASTYDLASATWEDGARTPPGSNSTDSMLPTISIDGGADLTLDPPIWRTVTSAGSAGQWPSLLYPIPSGTTITSGQTVTLTVASEFVDTVAGLVNPASDLAVTNGVGSPLAALSGAEKTMALGYNVNRGEPASPIVYQNNYRKYALASNWTPSNHQDNGYPAVGSTLIRYLIRTNEIGYPNPPGGKYRNMASGAYTLLWQDPSATGSKPALVPWDDTQSTFTLTSEDLSGAVKKRVYDVAIVSHFGSMMMDLPEGITEVKIHPPEVDADNPPDFHPEILRMAEGSNILRFMDWTKTNNSSLAVEADLSTTDLISSPWTRRTILTVDQFSAYDNAAGAFGAGGTDILCRTTAAHGLTTGQRIRFNTNPTNIDLVTNGTTDLFNFAAVVYVVSSTEFAFQYWRDDTVDGTQAVSIETHRDITPGPHPNETVSLCQAVGADPWICIPHPLNDAGVTALAEQFLAAMPAGMKIRVEYSNETWNSIFLQQSYCQMQARLSGIDDNDDEGDVRWYALRASECHQIFEDTFAASGRGDDVIRVFGSWLFSGSQARTNVILDYCNDPASFGATPSWWSSGAIPVDEVAVAPYLYSDPRVELFKSAYDAMTLDQLMDVYEHGLVRDEDFDKVVLHKAAIDTKYPTAKLVCYEGGLEVPSPTSMTNYDWYSRVLARQPRMLGLMTYFFERLQLAGCTAYVHYQLAGVIGGSGHGGSDAVWAAYTGWNEPRGVGDGTDSKFDNRTMDPGVDEHHEEYVSVVGQSIFDWLEALDAPGIGTGARRGRRNRHSFRRPV